MFRNIFGSFYIIVFFFVFRFNWVFFSKKSFFVGERSWYIVRFYIFYVLFLFREGRYGVEVFKDR